METIGIVAESIDSFVPELPADYVFFTVLATRLRSRP